jgi:myo-inositol-1(or 4)-monophosphatase
MSAKTATSVLDVDWLAVCRNATAKLKAAFDRRPSTPERAVGIGRGAGGDETLVIDGDAESAVFEELEQLGARGYQFRAISEERGEVVYGNDTSPVRVVIDPIDGSLNAKRLIPSFALSIAVSVGPTMEDVEFGFVHDFGAGEQYVARLAEGATVNGEPLELPADRAGLEVVGVESAKPEWIAPVAERLAGEVYRIRIVGSIALSLCYLAGARFDGMLTANTCRSVDVAAAQLIAREAGAFVSVLGHGGLEAPLDLESRFRIAAGRTPEGLEALVRALTDAGLPADSPGPARP